MKVITIGRSSENDVRIDDEQVSRHHFQIIQHDDGRFTLADFGSANGTYVNDRKVSGEVYLYENDIVRVGNTIVSWRMYFPGVPKQEPTPLKMSVVYPKRYLNENRNFWIFWLLSIVTFGIYSIIEWTRMVNDVNIIASPYDKRHTMHYCLMFFLLSWTTLGIYPLIWNHNFAKRVGNELRRRGVGYGFGAGTFWGWGFFGILLFGVGPLIYVYKLIHSMNLLCHDYNVRG